MSAPAPSVTVLIPVDTVSPPSPPPPLVQSELEEVLKDVFLEDMNPSVLAESVVFEWESRTAQLRSEASTELSNIRDQVEYYKKLEESCKGRSLSPDRLAVAKRERESQQSVSGSESFLEAQLQVEAEREKALEELELMKERALKAEAVREKALFAWQEGHDKEVLRLGESRKK